MVVIFLPSPHFVNFLLARFSISHETFLSYPLDKKIHIYNLYYSYSVR